MTESIKETVKKTSVVWICAILCAMLEFFLARFLAGIDEKNGLNAVLAFDRTIAAALSCNHPAEVFCG